MNIPLDIPNNKKEITRYGEGLLVLTPCIQLYCICGTQQPNLSGPQKKWQEIYESDLWSYSKTDIDRDLERLRCSLTFSWLWFCWGPICPGVRLLYTRSSAKSLESCPCPTQYNDTWLVPSLSELCSFCVKCWTPWTRWKLGKIEMDNLCWLTRYLEISMW